MLDTGYLGLQLGTFGNQHLVMLEVNHNAFQEMGQVKVDLAITQR